MDDGIQKIGVGAAKPALVDPFGRQITYLRLSVTDRCDFRCGYCMSENMTFLPKRELLSLEELDRICTVFIDLGIRKIRLTGGEPLVRKNVIWLIRRLGRHLHDGGLEELTLTTNASRLEHLASGLVEAGVRRVNVSLDSLDPKRFRQITRRGDLDTVLRGIEAGLKAGLRIKINTVALKGLNDDEFDSLVQWCGDKGMDLTLIETMPMGDVEGDRTDRYLPLSDVRRDLESRWSLSASNYRTGGPARYVTVEETGGRLGFITPLTGNFCDGCNRVRVTCTGTMYMCLGQDDKADLRTPLRTDPSDAYLSQTITEAITRKPKGHDFSIERYGQAPALDRHMSVTGG